MAWEKLNSQNVFNTPEGGIAIRVINKTGAPSKKGYIVKIDDNVDNGVKYIPGGNPDPVGIVYTDGIQDGEYMYIVITGITDVYYATNVARGTFSRMSTIAEGKPDGQAINEALPVPPFSTDKHFQEIGHPLESITGPGLAKTIVHFN